METAEIGWIQYAVTPTSAELMRMTAAFYNGTELLELGEAATYTAQVEVGLADGAGQVLVRLGFFSEQGKLVRPMHWLGCVAAFRSIQANLANPVNSEQDTVALELLAS